MGRHSPGAGKSPPPVADPASRHPYAPRSQEDTGAWDRRTYRVVDVGLLAGAPAARPPLRSVPEFDRPPSRFGAAETATREDTASRLRRPDPTDTGSRLRAPDLADTGSRLRGPDPADPRLRRPDPADTGSRLRAPEPADTGSWLRPPAPYGAEASLHGATRSDLYEPRYAAEPAAHPAVDPYDRLEPARSGATRADLAEPRLGGIAPAGFGVADPARPGPNGGAPTGFRFGPPDPAEPRLGSAGRTGSGFGGPDAAESRFGGDLDESRYGAAGPDAPRYGATRADLAESVGSTALAPRPAPDPDEVTDTGARRARSAFRLAPEADEADDTDYDHDEEAEPSLLLQWGIFLAQTLTGALAGLGVWLGFYRLWSSWPFYAVPAVGVAAIGMLVLARMLRRRHGHDLDLLTAIVTVGILTVLTVLPAAFTLQDLAQ
jgi:hypothetical protein